MRLATVEGPQGMTLVAARGDELVDLNAADANIPKTMKAVLRDWPEQSARVKSAIESGPALSALPQTWCAPVPDPQKVVCIGLNYADHAAETGAELPTEPVVFAKFPTTVIGHQAAIELPAVSRQVDYEAELVIVIGKEGRDIPLEEAGAHIAGFTCGHDVSARDWQKGKPGGQWLLGKSFDTFAPMGPFLVTADEIANPADLDIRMRVNGEVLQDSNTRQLIFPVEKLVSYVSSVARLLPGDVIFTGTPPGVGVARKPPKFLQAGDVAQVEIAGVGVLENPVRIRS